MDSNNPITRLSPLTEMLLPPWLTNMVLNLQIVKSFPCNPTRFCLYRIGPPGIIIFIKMDKKKIMG